MRAVRRTRWRIVAAAVAALAAVPVAAEPLRLDWPDLIPADQPAVGAAYGVRGVVTHEQGLALAPGAARAGAPLVRAELDGKDVEIAGYLVPLGLDGMRIYDFLVAPFLGACVHVPPPPSNQLLLAHFKAGMEISLKLFADPIVVTGRISISSVEADLGEQGNYMIGYQIEASRIRFLEQ